jgi:general secretion pathway protein D
MKTLITNFLTVACTAGLLATAAAQPAGNFDTNAGPPPDNGGPPPMDAPMAPPDGAMSGPSGNTTENTTGGNNTTTARGTSYRPTNARITAAAPAGSSQAQPDAQFVPPDQSASGSPNDLNLVFRNAPLDMVLNYLSDAAGFIIVQDTAVHGSVTVNGKHLTRDEAVDLLNSVLNKNGYAAIRDGRTLTIVDKDAAKTSNIPVKVSNDPGGIPNNDEIVTQIIPIRFVEAGDLVKDLSSFVSSSATIVANDAGNSIVITDTQANIHHLVEIIRAIDDSAEGETEIRVFHLEHANPTDVANELGQIFPSSNGSSTGTQSPIRFGGGGPGGFGGGGGPGGFFARMMAANSASASGSNARVQKQSQVVAVADLRTSSVIVTASKDLMQEIEGMMTQIDVASTRDQQVYVFHMNNGDPQQALQVLQNMFQTSTTSRSGSSSSTTTTSALQEREQQNASSSSSTTSGSSSSSSSGGLGGGGSRGGGGQLF